MKKTIRLLAMLLAFALALGVLSGCTPKSGDDPSRPGGGKNDPANPGTADNPAVSDPDGYSYVSSYSKIKVDGDAGYYDFRYIGGKLWYSNTEYIEEPVLGENGETVSLNYRQKTHLYNMDIDGSNRRELENYETHEPVEEGWQSNGSYIQNIVDAGDGNVWIVEGYSAYRNTAPANVEPYTDAWYNYQEYKSGAYLVRIDGNGTTLSLIDSSTFTPEDGSYFYISNAFATNDGRLVVLSDMSAYVLSSEGEKLGVITSDSYLGNTFAMKDGTIVTGSYSYDELTGEGKDVYRKLDLDAMKLGDEIEIPNAFNSYGFFTGTGDYDLYCRTSNGLNGIKLAEGTNEEILNFINIDVDGSDVNNLFAKEDGTFFAFSTDWSGDTPQYNMVNIYKVKNSEIPVKTVLTFACMYMNYNVRRQILSFNRNSDKYRIKVIDYSQYNTDKDYEAGLTKLTAELLAGNIPDMFDTNQLPLNRLAAKGYLEDLTPFIESDTGIGGADGLVKPIIDAVRAADGKLYFTVPTVYLSTIMAPTSLVGDLVRRNADGSVYWTIEDVMTALSRMPQGCDIMSKYTTASDMLYELVNYMLDDLIDWSTGECRFNSPDFVAILKFCDLFRKTPYDWDKEYDPGEEEDDETRFRSGKQMLYSTSVADFVDWRQYEKLIAADATFVGYPVASGSGSAWNISNNGNVAMSSRCTDKDGAWSFMRTFFTEEYQEDNYGIPTNKAVFDRKLDEACTPTYEDVYDENGNVTGKVETPKSWYWYGGGGGGVVYMEDKPVIMTKQAIVTGPSEQYPEERCIFALTEEQRDKIVSLVNSTTHTSTTDSSIHEIILEETAPFFDGKQTAEQTAETIQRRINLYVNEQR